MAKTTIPTGQIRDGTIVNGDISGSAGIDATKLGNGDVNNTKLSTLANVTSDVQAQIDAIITGVKWKAPVRVATVAAGTLATDFDDGSVVDGITLATGDRILIKNQVTGADNGIYVVAASGAPTRATDADSGTELVSASVFVQVGTVNADKAFLCTNDSITIGVTSLVFVAFATTLGALIAANNLSDLASATTARTNLGLGTKVYNEVPTGTINGSNATFTLAATPTAGTLRLYKDGMRQTPGSGNDYTISGLTITYEAGNEPETSSSHVADYITGGV